MASLPPYRCVLDTNVVIAGLLWRGPPHRLLTHALAGVIQLYSSPALIIELVNTLDYRKFGKRIAQLGADPDMLVNGYRAMATLVTPATLPRLVRDPDDDAVIAAAVASDAQLIVSGDRDLTVLGSVQSIRILTPAQAIAEIEAN